MEMVGVNDGSIVGLVAVLAFDLMGFGCWGFLFCLGFCNHSFGFKLAYLAAARDNGPVHLFICLFVRRHNTNMRFSQKLSNLEPWSLLTTYRKSYVGFSRKPLLDP